MSDKIKPRQNRFPKHRGDKRIVPLRAGGDKRIVPLRTREDYIEEIPVPNWDKRDRGW
jgi:hypothetical protein